MSDKLYSKVLYHEIQIFELVLPKRKHSTLINFVIMNIQFQNVPLFCAGMSSMEGELSLVCFPVGSEVFCSLRKEKF